MWAKKSLNRLHGYAVLFEYSFGAHVRRYIFSRCGSICCLYAGANRINKFIGPEVIKPFSCSAQLSMKFVLLISLKLLTIANSFLLNIAEHENYSATKYENANYFHIY